MKSRVMTAIFALALIAGAATLSLAPGPGSVSAAKGGNVEVTFTKWVTDLDFATFPWDMVGVVGGNVGAGSFTGEVLSRSDSGGIATIHAVYHVNGAKQSFTADLTVVQNNATGIADITGVVVDGPLNGAKVDGGYRTQSTCNIATPGNIFDTLCFKGTLHVDAGSAH